MLVFNLLKLHKERIESGWFKINADRRALCHFVRSIVAFDGCEKRCMSGEV